MTSTLPGDTSPGREKGHLKPNTAENSTIIAKMSASIKSADSDEMMKDLNSMSISPGNANVVDGENSVTGEMTTEEIAKAAAVRAKKTAMNKRKKENARRNKAESQEKKRKADEEAAYWKAIQTIKENDHLKKLFSGNAPPSIFDPALMKELDNFKDVLGFSPENVKEFQEIFGSMSASEIQHFETHMTMKDVSYEEYRDYKQTGVLPHEVVEPEGRVEDDYVLLDDPAGPPFVIKPVPGKGLGVIATRDIKKGSEIFREACLLETKSASSQTGIKIEASLNVLSNKSKEKYISLAEECGCKGGPCVETRVMRIWRANAFHNHIPKSRGEYVYEIASRINHSCIPNSRFGFTKEGYIVFFATRDIKKGLEITHDYKGAFGNTEMRRKILWERYGFECQCTACRDNVVISPEHIVNALRRGELSEVKTTGTTLLGGQTPAEVAALKLVAGWTEKIMQELTGMERHMQFALILQATATGKIPDANSPTVKKHVDLIGGYLRSENRFGLSDEFFTKFFARHIPCVLETAEQGFRVCGGAIANIVGATK